LVVSWALGLSAPGTSFTTLWGVDDLRSPEGWRKGVGDRSNL
jgi:hypothetical protein